MIDKEIAERIEKMHSACMETGIKLAILQLSQSVKIIKDPNPDETMMKTLEYCVEHLNEIAVKLKKTGWGSASTAFYTLANMLLHGPETFADYEFAVKTVVQKTILKDADQDVSKTYIKEIIKKAEEVNKKVMEKRSQKDEQ